MKDKKKIIIIAIIGTILVFGGTLFLVLRNMKEEERKEQETKENLVKYYEIFKENSDKFSDVKKEFNKKVLEDLFVESVVEDYDSWQEAIETYKEFVDDTLAKANDLQPYCVGKAYMDDNLNNYCNAYLINYETVNNYFIKDIEEFNKFIEEYLKNNPKADAKIKKYEIDNNIYKLIDANEDGEFK